MSTRSVIFPAKIVKFDHFTFQAKSLERSPAVGDFYGTGIEIWAGFGPVRQLLRLVFSCFNEQKNF